MPSTYPLALDVSYTQHRDGRILSVNSFATERADKVGDFVASGTITVRRLSASTNHQQHRGIAHYSVKVNGVGKPAVHIRSTATVFINGAQTTMSQFYAGMLAL